MRTVIYLTCEQKEGDYLSPRTGRPPSDNPKIERIYIRVTPDEKAEIFEFCEKFKVSMLDLIRKGIEAMKK